jgi:hypothetical protein
MFTRCSLAKEAPGYLPAAHAGGYSAVIRRRSRPGVVTRTPDRPPARQLSRRLTAPAPYPHDLRRSYVKTGNDTGSSHMPSRHARRAHAIQRY